MKPPVASLLAAFAAGAILLQQCPALPAAPGALASAVLGMTVGVLWLAARARYADGEIPARAGARRVVFLAASLCMTALLGFSYAAWRAQVRLSDELPVAWEQRDIRVIGLIDDLPQHDSNGTRFAFAVERCETPGAVVPSRLSLGWFAPHAGNEDITGEASVPRVHAGERWSLVVRLKRPHGNVNPDGFDLEAWLLERNLRATGHVREFPASIRLAEFAGRASDYVQRTRERIRTRIATALPGASYAGVLTALAIGDQRAITEAQWSIFNRTGVTHLVSISGLHVTVFASLAGGIALVLIRRSTALTSRIPARKLAAIAGAGCAFAYVLLAGAEVPAVRTLLMLLVAAAGLWLGRPGTALLVWLWSLAAVLLWDPWAGLSPGFWLSFGAVGLLLYAGSGRLQIDAHATRWRRLLHPLHDAARAQWIVTVGLVPGTLALFQQVSVVSALANAVAIPAVTLGIVPLALIGIVVPLDAPWQLAHGALAVLMRYLEWAATLPSATWASHAPRGWTVALAIGGVIWLLAPRGIPGRALGTVWMLPLAVVPPPPIAAGNVRITVLDVGQGLAIVVVTARHALLYDTGPRYGDTADAGGRIVAPFLRAAGIARLDALVVSHADSDHSGGARTILHDVRVERLLSSLPASHPVINEAARTGAASTCVAGTHWNWDGVTFTLLHPQRADYDDRPHKGNDLSCVLRIESAAGSAILTGDIEAAAESALVQAQSHALRADVLVVPHHGSRTSSTSAFIAAVRPAIAVVAAGYRNRFGHPRGDVLARYEQAGASRWRTDLQGAISVELTSGEPARAIGERERRGRYWYDAAR